MNIESTEYYKRDDKDWTREEWLLYYKQCDQLWDSGFTYGKLLNVDKWMWFTPEGYGIDFPYAVRIVNGYDTRA